METKRGARPAYAVLPQAVRQAAVIVEGEVAAVDGGAGSSIKVVVADVLKGAPPPRLTVDLEGRAGPAPGARGIFVLDDQEPHHLLASPSVGRRDVLRAMADLPVPDPAPTDAEIVDLAARADVVVFGRSRPTDQRERVLVDVVEILAGSTDERVLSVRRGPLPDQPGGPWAFPDVPFSGVYFLRHDGGEWETITAAPPTRIDRQRVIAALKGA